MFFGVCSLFGSHNFHLALCHVTCSIALSLPNEFEHAAFHIAGIGCSFPSISLVLMALRYFFDATFVVDNTLRSIGAKICIFPFAHSCRGRCRRLHHHHHHHHNRSSLIFSLPSFISFGFIRHAHTYSNKCAHTHTEDTRT